ncbi:MAG: hypothetical protein H6751_13940 [Candidatus Omnitrophica bacterium]|nr:hypothetical protein [Candidatus Omnitrophota bacterium]MCB9784060.1 hypothetical protein [Candidatus Omnitrophota bacterium]
MKGEAMIIPVGTLFRIEFFGKDWYLSFRHADGSSCMDFEDYDGEQVGPEVVAKFIPNYASLEWKESKKNFQNSSEYHAIDGKFRINLVGKPGKQIEKEILIQEFLEFMGSE